MLAARAAGRGIGAALPDILTVGGIALVVGIISRVQENQQVLLNARVTRESQNRILDAATKVELSRFEDPEFFDHLQRARDASQMGVWQVVGGVTGLLSNVASTIGVLAALASLQPLLIPLVALGAVPLVLISRNVTRRTYRFRLWRTPGERERNYLTQLLTGKDEAKEVRAFNLRPHLRARYDRLYDDFLNEYKKLQRSQLLSGFESAAATQGAMVLTFGVPLAFLFSAA